MLYGGSGSRQGVGARWHVGCRGGGAQGGRWKFAFAAGKTEGNILVRWEDGGCDMNGRC